MSSEEYERKIKETEASKLEKRALYGILSILVIVCGYFITTGIYDMKSTVTTSAQQLREDVKSVRGDVKAVSDKMETINVNCVSTNQKLLDHIASDDAIHQQWVNSRRNTVSAVR